MNLKELIAQRAALDAQITQAKVDSFAQTVKKVRELILESGSTIDEVFDAITVINQPVKKVDPKWRNSQTGQTWTGRGKKPKWVLETPELMELIPK